MRHILVVLLAVVAWSPVLLAADLTVAVVQLPMLVEPEQVRAELPGLNLREATDEDRMRAKGSVLRMGTVNVAQTFAAREGVFGSSTRIGNQKVQVDGRLTGNRLSLEVVVSTGVEGPFRRFTRTVYRGEGVLEGTQAALISLKQVRGQQATVVKGGRAKMNTTTHSFLLLAQRK